ncbi:MAG: dihydrodipicolinate synthase family protein [Proteobacteria bacterium]|nr:dihydrodipicolinate synthase family protein [Pseudomonadota bacterium]
MKKTWTGVFPAMTTQMRQDQSLDLDATSRHIEVMIDSGVSGLIMLGSLGENITLTRDERLAVMRAAVEAADGRVPVLSGVAECSTAAACEYARNLERLGADGSMLLPAMVYRADARETLAHYRSVARATDLPIICYNNPLAYTVDITPAMFEQLANLDNLVAIKESSGDVRRITDLINRLGDRYTLFCGVDDLVLESVMLGARGWIAGMGLAFPAENQRLWELAVAGEWRRARELYRWFTPLLHLDIPVKFVQYIKLAVQEAGLGREWVRAPRLPITGAERKRILDIIHHGLATRPLARKRRR